MQLFAFPDRPDHLFGHRIIAAGSERVAFCHPKKGQPNPRQQPVACNCLISIFRTGRLMATGIADQIGQGKLIKPNEADPQQARGCFWPWPRIIPAIACILSHWLQSVQDNPPLHQMSTWLRRGGPCNLSPVPDI